MKTHIDYRLSRPGALVALVFALFTPVLADVWPDPLQLATVLGAVALSVAALGLPTMLSINEEGLAWGAFAKLPWSEIRSVRRISFLGLPHLLITRAHGVRWRLPLYIRGPVPFESAVVDLAPNDNPLHAYACAVAGAQLRAQAGRPAAGASSGQLRRWAEWGQ